MSQTPEERSRPTPDEPASGSAGSQAGRAFEDAARSGRKSLVGELFYYVRLYKRWSIVPILLALAVLGALITLGSSGAAPFIYALF